MSTGNSDLFTYLVASFGTAAALFGAHALYASYIDMRYHEQKNHEPQSELAVAARKEQDDKLAAGKVGIDQAKADLAQKGRKSFASIAAFKSDDLSPISGWMHHPSFKPVVAHPIRAPRVIAPAEPAPAAVDGDPAPAAAPPALEAAAVAPKKVPAAPVRPRPAARPH